MANQPLADLSGLLEAVRSAPERSIWVSYDEQADVLYVSFRYPSVATDSELTDNDVIVRFDGDEVIGYTFLHASERVRADAA